VDYNDSKDLSQNLAFVAFFICAWLWHLYAQACTKATRGRERLGTEPETCSAPPATCRKPSRARAGDRTRP